MTLEREKSILENPLEFGDTILRGGHGIRDLVQNSAHMLTGLAHQKCQLPPERISTTLGTTVVQGAQGAHCKEVKKYLKHENAGEIISWDSEIDFSEFS